MAKQELINVCENVWTVDGMTRFVPGAHIQGRCSIVRLEDGGLLVHSPILLGDDVWNEICKLGPVQFLFAPNLYHHMFLADTQRRFKDARVIAPEGLSRKNQSVRYDTLLAPESLQQIPQDFDAVFIEGAPRFDEIVLLHKQSGSLIVGDYFFNVQKYKGWLARPILRLTDTLEKATQSKAWRQVTRDRELMRKSAQKVLELDFSRVIMCHGEPLLAGPDWATQALAWLEK